MKGLVITLAVFAANAFIAMADPAASCNDLVGTYAEPREPGKAILVVAYTNNEFSVMDATGKKTIVEVKQTEGGLVFVENPRARNVFRLSTSAKPGVYVFEYLGKHKQGSPLPEGPGEKREVVRTQLTQTSTDKK
jgi:hypothetical protein